MRKNIVRYETVEEGYFENHALQASWVLLFVAFAPEEEAALVIEAQRGVPLRSV